MQSDREGVKEGITNEKKDKREKNIARKINKEECK